MEKKASLKCFLYVKLNRKSLLLPFNPIKLLSKIKYLGLGESLKVTCLVYFRANKYVGEIVEEQEFSGLK